MKEENKTIIRALNKYGRVPQQYELLNMIDELEKSNKELYDVQFKLFNIINKNINNLELTDDECVFIDYYMNKLNSLYMLGDE